MKSRPLTHYAGLSIAAALVTMALKLFAWRLTGSVGLLSDALESLVNLGAAVALLTVLIIAARPADAGHPYGHSKAEYFASGFEGLLILFAGAAILAAAGPRLLDPRPIAQPGLGLTISALASLVNLGVALALARAGRRARSPALVADARHLMTDVWTSAGVILGVGLVAVTGWLALDALVAIAVALHILWTGLQVLGESSAGLMDAAWPENEQRELDAILAGFREPGIDFHALRTRRAGARRFCSLHVLVPGQWSVQRGHDLLEAIEVAINARMPGVQVLTHLEPIEDPASYADQELTPLGDE